MYNKVEMSEVGNYRSFFCGILSCLSLTCDNLLFFSSFWYIFQIGPSKRFYFASGPQGCSYSLPQVFSILNY